MDLSDYPPSYIEEDISHRPYGTAIAFIILEIGATVLRFISRRMSKTRLATDDYLILPSLLFCLGVCILAIVGVEMTGVGRHFVVVVATDPGAAIGSLKAYYAVEQLYCLAVAFPKLSIVSTYLRIFTEKPYRWTAYVVATIIAANAVAGVITSFAACPNFSDRWDPTKLGNCIDTIQFWRWISFPNILTDVVLLVLPLPVVWKLQMPRSQKIALMFVFLTGSVGIIASIVRFTAFYNVTALADTTFVSANLLIWSIVEPGTYHIAACLPPMRPLLLMGFEKFSSIVASSRDRSRSSRLTEDDMSQKAVNPNIHVSNEIELHWTNADAEDGKPDSPSSGGFYDLV